MRRNSSSHRKPTPAIFAPAALLLILLGLGTLAPAAGAQATGIDRDSAVSIVTQTQLGGTLEGIRLYVDPQPLVAGRTMSAWHKEVFTAPASGWFVFVDRYPGANWEHPCWYFLVDATSGSVQRFDATTPPLNLSELSEITHGQDNPADGASEEILSRFSERLAQLPKPAPASRGQAWAFIISGGADQSNNHIRYWNDCAFIYRTLVQYYGYADDHIRVCMSDGVSPAVDRSNGTNSPTDLDGDGDADTEYPATLPYIGQVFGELAAALTPSDQLFIFTTDHGGQESGQNCYLNLWSMQELRDDQMAAYIAALPCQSIICTFEQCYSGGMIDDLTGDGRIISTACAWSELSWAMAPDYVYDTFVYHWTCAVAWQTPAGAPVDADNNNDNLVSMREAFLYAEAHDGDNETPQYNSTPAGLGDMLNLVGNMEGVYLALDGATVNDDNVGASHGNGDGVIDFGETIELTVALHNMGQSDAANVVGTLTSGSPYVTLVSAVRGFGSIPADGIASNSLPFVFSVANDVPNGESLGLALSVTEEPGTVPLGLTAAAPTYVVEVLSVNDGTGDDDGMADPGENVGLTLRFHNEGGCCSPVVSAALQGSEYFETDGLAHPVGAIPAGQHMDVYGFTVQISPDCPAVYTGQLMLALTGPQSYTASAGLRLSVGPWFDDAEASAGWSLGVAGDGATTGQWVLADPVGTNYNGQPAQSEDDHTDAPGHICFVTGNGAAGGAAGDADVDGGKTTLLSPVFNLQDASSARLTYWRWYTNNLGNSPGLDYWNVDATADGSNWVALEHTVESANSWTEHSFDLFSIIPFTGSVRFRFVADDVAPGTLVEAALDDITVSIVRPTTDVPANETIQPTGLGACRPNPVGAGSVLTYRLAGRTSLRLDLYDVAGRRVRTLVNGSVAAGEHALQFAPVDGAGRRVAAGVYFIRMETPEVTQVRQITIVP